MTYSALLRDNAAKLGNPDTRESALDSRQILMRAAGIPRRELIERYKEEVPENVTETNARLIARRAAGEPLAYILGEWDFFGLTLKVTHDTLIPRPDTERLAETALKLFPDKLKSLKILDLCAGSGCIGLALAKNLPNARVTLADVSEPALAVARENALNLGLDVETVLADALKPPENFPEFDLLASNPPYIKTRDVNNAFEPRIALDGGADGLDFYRAIEKYWFPLVKKGGFAVLEVDNGEIKVYNL